MIVPILLIILGFALLIFGAGKLIEGATILAKKLNMSDLAIGLTIVAFGTSFPELVVNTFSSFQNQQELVFGNVIGSNLFNLFMILGITGLITPLLVEKSTVWKEIPISFMATILFFFLVNDSIFGNKNMLTRLDGVVLLVFFGAFLYYISKQLRADQKINTSENKIFSAPKTIMYIFLGLILLVIGAELVVDNAVKIAENHGVSQKIIGLTIVAAGTSLPELVTTIVAATKKNAGIAVGNIIGSNIFNITLILGSSALIRPINYDPIFNLDTGILLGGTLFLFIAMFTGIRKKLDRWEAAILLVTYLFYLTYLIQKEI
jgi:cation:H+ antiporter